MRHELANYLTYLCICLRLYLFYTHLRSAYAELRTGALGTVLRAYAYLSGRIPTRVKYHPSAHHIINSLTDSHKAKTKPAITKSAILRSTTKLPNPGKAP